MKLSDRIKNSGFKIFMKSDDDKRFIKEKRSFNRFDVKKQSVEIELIVDDYRRVHALSLIDNISLGGMKILIKEVIPVKSDIKFKIGKSKTIFHAVVVWCREADTESYSHSAGIRFEFPFEEEANIQKKELIAFVYNTLNRLPKEQLIDRLMKLFIERRRIFDAAKERIDQVETVVKEYHDKTQLTLDVAHNIIDYSLSGAVYFNKDYSVLYSNQMAEEITGYSSGEFKDLRSVSFLSDNTEKMMRRYYKSSNTGIYNGVIAGKNGEEIKVRWRVLKNITKGKEIICFMFSQKT